MAIHMTPEEYGRRRGCTARAVLKAVEGGRIVSAHRDGSRWLIDAEKADLEWAENTTPRVLVETHSPAAATSTAELRAVRLRREAAAAERLELANSQERGDLIPRAEVRRDLDEAASVFFTAVESLPDRLAPLLAGIEDQARIRALLDAELDVFVAQFADALERAAQGDPA